MRFDADINAYSLGGLPRRGGGLTADSLWRSATPDVLDSDGWADLAQVGVCRIVDLRNAGERQPATGRPTDLEVVTVPLEDPDDPEYTSLWDRNWAHPDFYAWGLTHWPELWRAAFSAIAEAPVGVVLIHCAGGRDRTGMLSAILLEIADVERDAVLEDYARGVRGTNEMLRRQGRSVHEAAVPDDQLDAIIAKYSEALNGLLDRLRVLLDGNGLEEVASRASSRLRAG
jgi:protein-tyrosine phosphatase